jgi:hypothetical protein
METKAGLYALGRVMDIEDRISDKTKKVYGKTVWLKMGNGEPMQFNCYIDEKNPIEITAKRDDIVSINYVDGLNTYKGRTKIERRFFKDSIKTVNQTPVTTPEKKLANVKV